MALDRVRKLRRSTQLLHFFSLLLMAVGAVCLLPLTSTDFLLRITGVVTLASGGAGVVGLAFTWYRALAAFTSFSWVAAALSIYGTTRLIVTRPVQVSPFPWIFWIVSLLVALPPSILSSTMHILRVWRSQPMVSADTTAPLVEAAADDDLPPPDAPPPAKGMPGPPVWPPRAPNGSAAFRDVEGGSEAASPSADSETYVAYAQPPSWPPRVD